MPKGKKNCGACQAQIHSGAAFCPKCGSQALLSPVRLGMHSVVCKLKGDEARLIREVRPAFVSDVKQFVDIVNSLTLEELSTKPRRCLRLGIPTELDEVIKAECRRSYQPYVQVLIKAAQKMVEANPIELTWDI
jgi:hypothetical protein